MSIVNGEGSCPLPAGPLCLAPPEYRSWGEDSSLAAAAQTVQSAPVVPPPSSADVTLPPAVTAGLVGWLVFAVGAAAVVGVFKKRSILGPQRLGEGRAAVSLLLDFFAGIAVMMVALGLASLWHPKGLTAILLASCIAELLGWGTIVLLIFGNGRAGRLGVALRLIPRGMMIGVVAMFILFPIVAATSQATGAVLHWMGKPPPAPHEVLESLGDTHDPRVVAVDVIAAVVVAPLAEELAFRCVLQTVIGFAIAWLLGRRFAGEIPAAEGIGAVAGTAADGGGAIQLEYRTAPRPRPIPSSLAARWLAVLITAACFAAVHDVAAFFPALFVLAIGLGYVYERTGNLWCTVTMHALFNGFEIALFLSPLGR